ncbi:response regulator transcription factor [Clostridium felsineum]|uniref:Stage 0 sporulation protein A homolog n=1 Tax=Clostridium felsineum TaxID=36839 RepID=A0A1S8KYB8_9CLOT|nr:response regulator transcription factor [Clostridium felsineum]URZ02541.1 Transcriptional regulatory protein SrrA [Clostridium felsineum]URZ09765.1 Transcriptional regulatory protein SrrA [Clostridium felsineum]
MDKILIIEDNVDVNKMLNEALTEAGYKVKSAYTGIDGIKEVKGQEYSMVLLDLMLPYKSGDQVLKEMREFSEVPVIVISAKDMISTKIDILKLGADDYITKPFDLGEVVARVEANLRRSNKTVSDNEVINYKDIWLDENTKRVSVKDVEIDLTAKEYKILTMLMKNKGKVFTKANLYESIWEEDYLGDDNAIKTHVSNIRNKLKKVNSKEKYIETVWGLGYRLFKE